MACEIWSDMSSKTYMMQVRCTASATASTATREEVAKEKVTVLLCVCVHACACALILVYMNGDGSNRQVLITVGKLLHPHCLKSIKSSQDILHH